MTDQPSSVTDLVLAMRRGLDLFRLRYVRFLIDSGRISDNLPAEPARADELPLPTAYRLLRMRDAVWAGRFVQGDCTPTATTIRRWR